MDRNTLRKSHTVTKRSSLSEEMMQNSPHEKQSQNPFTDQQPNGCTSQSRNTPDLNKFKIKNKEKERIPAVITFESELNLSITTEKKDRSDNKSPS